MNIKQLRAWLDAEEWKWPIGMTDSFEDSEIVVLSEDKYFLADASYLANVGVVLYPIDNIHTAIFYNEPAPIIDHELRRAYD